MPMLAHLFHLSPTDVWDLTSGEVRAYMEAAPEIVKAMTP